MRRVLGILIILTAPWLAWAPAEAEQLAAVYASYWAGLPAAQIRFGLDVTDAHYRSKLSIETEGLPRWFTHFRALVADEGAFAAKGTTEPRHYDAHFDLRKRRDRLISFTFNPNDGALQAERDQGDTSGKPQLAANYRRDVLDPLAALLAIRRRLAEDRPPPDQHFLVPVYDGARRFDVDAAVQARQEMDGLLHLKLMLRPIAGFKGESSSEGDPDSAPRPVEVAFTDDSRLLPVSLRVSIAFLPFTVHLERACNDFESCQATGKAP